MMPESLSVNGKPYRVLRLLGHGKGGYSYLVTDGQNRYVLKQIHHEPCSYYTFGDKLQSEINDYQRLRTIGIPMPAMLDVDTAGERILKEYIEGDTIYDLVLRGRMIPDYLEQMRDMCRLLYDAHTNIDYFPTNFIPRGEGLVYVDYECNGYMEEWDFQHWGVKYWSRTPDFLAYEARRRP